MGIKGEIEKAVSMGMGIVVEGGQDMVSRSLYRQRDRIVADVLSILDEWECVAEFPLDVELKTTKHLAGRFMDEETLIDIVTDQHRFKLGDHIIIYRRKKR